jgi:aminoglycoside N3'-acetyltransferase
MIIEDIVDELEKIVGNKQESIVIYSALWPLLRLANMPVQELVPELCSKVMSRFSGRTILMPTFTSGFDKDGVCDLDITPSQTGALSEYFRSCPNVQRTCSAFFSFAVYGPNTEMLISLRPDEAWGSDSLYEWMYNQDAAIVTLGLHPTHCSYTHFGEWLNRKKISYRFNKTFSGALIHDEVTRRHTETLFIRKRDPEPVNDFTHLLPAYIASGMQVVKPHEFPISCIGAKAKIDVVSSVISKNPLALISNKEQFSHYDK